MAELKSFYEYFSKYPQDDTLRDILLCAKVKKIMANKDERKLKAYLLFENFVPSSVLNILSRNIKDSYGLREVSVIDCYESLSGAEYLTNVTEQLCAEIPVLSGYCDGEFEFNDNVFILLVKFGGAEMLKNMKCNIKAQELLNIKFNTQLKVDFQDKTMERLTFSQFKEKISIYEEKPEIKHIEQKQDTIKPNKVLMGKKIESNSMDIGDVRANSGMVTVTGSVYGIKKINLNENSQLMIFSIEDKTGAVEVKFFITEKTAQAAESLQEDDYITLQAKAEEDVRSGGIVLRARSISGAQKEEKLDNAELKRSELHIHSTMSPADGLATPEEIIDRASKWGFKAIAITDHGVVHSFPKALKYAKDKNIKVLCGCEAYLVEDTESAVYGAGNIGFKDRFVIFDIETTGLSISSDRITEIGAVVVENGETKEVFSTFVNPEMKIPQRITELTGITDQMVADAPLEKEALEKFFDYVKDAVLVAHNANFDCGFMRAAAKRCGLNFDFTYIDTVPICRSVFPELKSVKLNVVAEHIGAPKFNHHRAYDDAKELAFIFNFLINRLENRGGINNISLINESLKGDTVSVQRSTHATILARNKVGLKNLYKIISLSHDEYFQKYPLVPKSLLSENREGLLIGSSCCDGELFKMLLEERSEDDILSACRFYDYFEIQPLSNNMNMVDSGYIRESDQLRRMYTQLMKYGKMLGKPVIATGDAHFLEEEQEQVRDIALSVRGNRFDHSKGPIYFKTTEEMLADFEWVSKEEALNLVINTPNSIADMCEDMASFEEFISPYSGNQKLTDIINIDEITDLAKKDRVISEIKFLEEENKESVFLFAYQLSEIAEGDGYPCSFTGDISTYLIGYILGLTDIDPYEHNIDFEKSSFDNISVVFLPEYQNIFLESIDRVFGKNHYFYASQIELLAHDSVRGYIRRYEENMHCVVREHIARKAYQLMENSKKQLRLVEDSIYIIPENMEYFDFCPVHKVFNENGESKIASHFDMDAFKDTLLRLKFSDNINQTVLKLLEQSTGKKSADIALGDNSVYELISKSPKELLPDFLQGIEGAGVLREKGRGIESFEQLSVVIGSVPEAMITYKLLWYKKYFTAEFFAAVLSAFVKKVPKTVYFEEREACSRAYNKGGDEDETKVLKILHEMNLNGFSLGSFSLYDSNAFGFKANGNKIDLPLILIDDMSEDNAFAIVKERGISEFQSVADLAARCGLGKKATDAMRDKGLFMNLDENAQMSMFSLF